MSKKVTTEVGGKRLDLTNLDKVLYPDVGVVKAEVIEYYLKVAPIILRHIKGRMMTFVRFPDGVDAESFFQKNRPESAPKWIATHADGETEYVLVNDAATLIWAASQGALELHLVATRHPHHDKPDYVVFDIDPPVDYPAADLLEIVHALRAWLEDHGHHPFVKTSGRKGLHLVCPVRPQEDCDRAFAVAQEIAGGFVRRHRANTTLSISKAERVDRVLIDVGRNRPSQTIVAPYSLRGAAGAPVSMPLRWEEVEASETAVPGYSLFEVPEKLAREGDAWEGMAAFAASIVANPGAKGPPGDRGSLTQYAGKRDFDRSSEPSPSGSSKAQSSDQWRFVVQRHRARNLHYDLRLERDGVLRSWAVPKGLPPRTGVKRLAVEVEDHPLKYLDFEGTIPKGEYGAGRMDVFLHGHYTVTKDKKDGLYFRLAASGLGAEFRLIHTGAKDWLLERLDAAEVEWLRDPPSPMLPEIVARPPVGAQYLFEVKWDGIRAIVTMEDRTARIFSRSGKEITAQFPEVVETLGDTAELANGVFDGELLCLDEAGRPQFTQVVSRLNASSRKVEANARRHPATLYLFDCLFLDGVVIARSPQHERRKWLERAMIPSATVRISEWVTEGRQLHQAAVEAGLEGTIAKDRNGIYRPGIRSDVWLKVKARETEDCLMVGYTRNMRRGGAIKGAVLAQRGERGGLRHVGNVAVTGEALARLSGEPEGEAVPIVGVDRRLQESITWISQPLMCEVRYSSWTEGENYAIRCSCVFGQIWPN